MWRGCPCLRTTPGVLPSVVPAASMPAVFLPDGNTIVKVAHVGTIHTSSGAPHLVANTIHGVTVGATIKDHDECSISNRRCGSGGGAGMSTSNVAITLSTSPPSLFGGKLDVNGPSTIVVTSVSVVSLTPRPIVPMVKEATVLLFNEICALALAIVKIASSNKLSSSARVLSSSTSTGSPGCSGTAAPHATNNTGNFTHTVGATITPGPGDTVGKSSPLCSVSKPGKK